MTLTITHPFISGVVDGGDVTKVRPSNWNATHTVTGTVDASQVANDTVTYAKIQNVSATDRLLGRDTASAGDIEELTVSGGLEFTGSLGIQTTAFTGDVTKTAGGTALTIASNAVVTAKIADDNVTYAKIQNVSATNRFLGRITSGAGDTEELTGTQATTLLDTFTNSLKGLVPAQSNIRTKLIANTTYYIRTAPTTVTVSIASPAEVAWSSHGLSINDPVIFSSPLDRGSCTITIASPGVVTKTAHGYVNGDPIKFTTSGTLPTGLTAGTKYYVVNKATDTFQVSATLAGSAINTSVSQTGTHYVERANTLPTGITDGSLYYVISAGFAANSFRFSSTQGGSAVNTSGSQEGRIVAQTGNNTNDGTAADRAHAFLSLWGAMTTVFAAIDLNGYGVIFQLADGTYAGSHTVGCKINITDAFSSGSDIRPPVGNGTVSIVGNSSNPDAVNGSGSGNLLSFRTQRSNSELWTITGMRLASDFSDTITSNGVSILVTNVNYNGGAAFWAALGPGTSIYSTNGTSLYQILSDPGDGALFVAAHGGTISLQSSDTVRAIGTRTLSHAFIDLADDEEGLPASFDNQGVTIDGVWAGILYRTAWGSQAISFTSSVFNAEYPATLTPGAVSPFGRWYERIDGTTVTTRYGADGSPVDAYYDYQTPAAGFSITIGNYVGHLESIRHTCYRHNHDARRSD